MLRLLAGLLSLVAVRGGDVERRETFRILEVDTVGAALEASFCGLHIIGFARRDELGPVLFQGEIAADELHDSRRWRGGQPPRRRLGSL